MDVAQFIFCISLIFYININAIRVLLFRLILLLKVIFFIIKATFNDVCTFLLLPLVFPIFLYLLILNRESSSSLIFLSHFYNRNVAILYLIFL